MRGLHFAAPLLLSIATILAACEGDPFVGRYEGPFESEGDSLVQGVRRDELTIDVRRKVGGQYELAFVGPSMYTCTFAAKRAADGRLDVTDDRCDVMSNEFALGVGRAVLNGEQPRQPLSFSLEGGALAEGSMEATFEVRQGESRQRLRWRGERQ